jgi:hypothetical protein
MRVRRWPNGEVSVTAKLDNFWWKACKVTNCNNIILAVEETGMCWDHRQKFIGMKVHRLVEAIKDAKKPDQEHKP